MATFSNAPLVYGQSQPLVSTTPVMQVVSVAPGTGTAGVLGQLVAVGASTGIVYMLVGATSAGYSWVAITGGEGEFFSLTVDTFITAGTTITAGTSIAAGTSITAGTTITAGGAISSINNDILVAGNGNIGITGNGSMVIQGDGGLALAGNGVAGAPAINIDLPALSFGRNTAGTYVLMDSAQDNASMQFSGDGQLMVFSGDGSSIGMSGDGASVAAFGTTSFVGGTVVVAGGDFDPGAGAETVMSAARNDTQGVGVMTILSTTGNPGDNTGYLKFYINGNTPAYVPYFTDIAP